MLLRSKFWIMVDTRSLHINIGLKVESFKLFRKGHLIEEGTVPQFDSEI